MATVTIQDEGRTLTDVQEIRDFLTPFGIWYENWDVEGRIGVDATNEEILSAYEPEIERLKNKGGFVTADVINVTPETLGQLIKLVDGKILNMPTAREVFAVMFAEGGDPDAIVKAKGLAQVSDTGAIEAMVDQIIADHAQSVEDYRGGKQAALQFLIGQVMRISKGKANPAMVRDLFLQRLG